MDVYRTSARRHDEVVCERPFFPRVGDAVRVVKRVEEFRVDHVGEIGIVNYVLGTVYAVSFGSGRGFFFFQELGPVMR